MKSALILIWTTGLLLCCIDSHSQTQGSSIWRLEIVSDSLYNSPQRINLLRLHKEFRPDYRIDLAYSDSILLRTSSFAELHGALAAVNGSFFDMDEGGSVCYLEKNDTVINLSRDSGINWGVADSIINAALILHKDSGLLIRSAMPWQYYEQSTQEDFVIISGPLLLKDSLPQKLPHMSFTHKRHPRTCIAITGECIIFITIDGRSEQAAGMNLIEVQEFLLSLGCVDALNLDGGGSTSMWISDRGIINVPSDKTGERPVANALLILKKR